MDIHCGTVTISGLMTDEFGMQDHKRIGYNVPFWEWPEGRSFHISPRNGCTNTCQIRSSRKLGQDSPNQLKSHTNNQAFHEARRRRDARCKLSLQQLSSRIQTDKQTLGSLIMHGAKLTPEEYQPIKQGFLACIGKEGAYTVSPPLPLSHHLMLTSQSMSYHYNWAVKKSEA